MFRQFFNFMGRIYPVFALVFVVGLASGLNAGSDAIPASTSSCDLSSFQVRFVPACPAAKDRDSMFFYEEATFPRLSIETSEHMPVEAESSPVMAAFGAALPPVGRPNASALLQSVDLLSENLFQSPSRMIALKQSVASGREGFVSFYVCNDSDGSGKCSDKKDSQQLSVHTMSFPRCHIPPVVQIRVWAGCR